MEIDHTYETRAYGMCIRLCEKNSVMPLSRDYDVIKVKNSRFWPIWACFGLNTIFSEVYKMVRRLTPHMKLDLKGRALVYVKKFCDHVMTSL